MIGDFISRVESALKAIEDFPRREVSIFHHNDCDGLTSGAVVEETFRRKGYVTKRYCLEKPYPPLLERVFSQSGELIVFADFAGRIAPLISRLNGGKNLTIILDHHVAEEATDPMVFNLDPSLYGLKGDRDITASTTCYLFSKAWDENNIDLCRPAALGAVGDGFFVDGRLVDENRNVVMDAVKQGYMEIVKKEWGEEYLIHYGTKSYKCRELGSYLDTLGGVGYQDGGPDTGVEVALGGPGETSDRRVKRLRVLQEEIFERETERLKSGALKKTKHIQWFNLGNRFSPMGVKMVGVFCEKLKGEEFISDNRYIAGFQEIPGEIPKFGKLDMHHTKVSMRVPSKIREKIIRKQIPGLDYLLPEATGRLGGFSDACHSLTAATVVEIGQEEALVMEMEKILEEEKGFKEEF